MITSAFLRAPGTIWFIGRDGSLLVRRGQSVGPQFVRNIHAGDRGLIFEWCDQGNPNEITLVTVSYEHVAYWEETIINRREGKRADDRH